MSITTPLTWYGHDLSVLIAYLLLGIAIKYVDQAYDIRAFKKKDALRLSIVTAVLMGLLMVLDPPSAAIFLAVSIGVAVANKIDNIAFYISLWLVIIIPLLFSSLTHFLWLPFSVLLIAAIADEYGNNWADKHLKNKKRQKSSLNETLALLFRYRCAMKLTMLLLVMQELLPLVYLPAFLLFDIGYVAMEKLSWALKPYRLNNPKAKNEILMEERPKERPPRIETLVEMQA